MVGAIEDETSMDFRHPDTSSVAVARIAIGSEILMNSILANYGTIFFVLSLQVIVNGGSFPCSISVAAVALDDNLRNRKTACVELYPFVVKLN
jgi:hypothetical protein